MTDYLTVAEVLAMHADQIERYGGSQGVRDQGAGSRALPAADRLLRTPRAHPVPPIDCGTVPKKWGRPASSVTFGYRSQTLFRERGADA